MQRNLTKGSLAHPFFPSSTDFVPGTVLGSGETAVNKTKFLPSLILNSGEGSGKHYEQKKKEVKYVMC